MDINTGDKIQIKYLSLVIELNLKNSKEIIMYINTAKIDKVVHTRLKSVKQCTKVMD